jgi:hypothetical protein
VGNGSITGSFTTGGNNGFNGNGYTYTWYDGTSLTGTGRTDQGSGLGTVADPFILTNLAPANYTIEVSDNDNGCTLIKTYEILEELYYPMLSIPASQVVANTTCSSVGNGTITINDADITYSAGSSSVSDYTWTVTSANGATVSGNTSPYTFAGTADSLSLTDLNVGTYTIVAAHNNTTCANGGFTVVIEDESILPVIDNFISVDNANCTDGSVAQGSIEILSIDGTADFTNYVFRWLQNTDGTSNATEAITNQLDNTSQGIDVTMTQGSYNINTNGALVSGLTDGFYTVEVINTTNGNCTSTQVIQVDNSPVYPIINSYTVDKNIGCGPIATGAFELTSISLDGMIDEDSSSLANNYTLRFFESDGSTIITNPNSATQPLTIVQLKSGTYFASVFSNNANCESDLVQFDIEDSPFEPIVQIALIEADSSCNTNGISNGSIVAITDNYTGNNSSEYTFSWTDESNNIISTNDTLTNVYAGTYTVDVTFIPLACNTIASYTIENEPLTPIITGIDTISVTTCIPSDGKFAITSVSSGNLNDYRYDFYDEDPSNGAIPIQSGLNSEISSQATGYNLEPGNYYAIATHINLGCSTPAIQIELEDLRDPVIINLEFFTKMTNCNPALGNGSLTVSANGSTDTTAYTFQWIDELNNIIENNNFYVKELPVGNYTVNITERSTGCIYSENYTMSQEEGISPITLSLSTSGNTNCKNPNGVVAGTVLNIPDIPDNPFVDNREEEVRRSFEDYKFYWFIGDLTSGLTISDTVNADYTGSLVENLISGEYTVFVVDQIDPMCTSEPTLVKVRDETLTPEVVVKVVNHRTICYEGQPDGRAKVSFPDSTMTFRYEFEWILGTDTSAAPFATGVSVDSLDIAIYSVKITDRVTGCRNFTNFEIIDGSEPVVPT